MGTNYYLHTEVCSHCGRGDAPLHIGKSSAGWCFSLHVMPERGLNSLADWIAEWSKPGARIEDEYGVTHDAAHMLIWITDRSWAGRDKMSAWDMARNHAEPGPNGLLRHRIDGDGSHCIGHGDGTWDLITGEFS